MSPITRPAATEIGETLMAPNLTQTRHLSAFVPLVVLATAWTVVIAGAGITSAAPEKQSAPDAAIVLERAGGYQQAIVAPASVSDHARGRVSGGNATAIVARSSTTGIPAVALAAYQRAETLINDVDASCHLTWQLVAAIGRVESDHGRAQGNAFDRDGVAKPGIFGIALDGSHHTSAVTDSDAGEFDNDTRWDRAVGPMQFIPSTWSAVGVDADGDGRRNPQDIDDAALAAAVYLCSGVDDLSTGPGQRTAVYRYNHSRSYVDLVIQIAATYVDGGFMADWGALLYAGPAAFPSNHGSSSRAPGTRVPGPHADSDGASAEPAPVEPAPAAAPEPTQPAPAKPQPAGKIDDLVTVVEKTRDVVDDTVQSVCNVLTLVHLITHCIAAG